MEERKIDQIYEMYGMTGDRAWARDFYRLAVACIAKSKTREEFVEIATTMYPSEKNRKRKLKKIWDYLNEKKEVAWK